MKGVVTGSDVMLGLVHERYDEPVEGEATKHKKGPSFQRSLKHHIFYL